MKAMIKRNKVSRNDTFCMLHGLVDEDGKYTQYRISDVPLKNLPAETVRELREGNDVTFHVLPPNEVAAFVKSWDVWERYLVEMDADKDHLFGTLEAFSKYDNPPLWGTYNLGDINRYSSPVPDEVA